MKASGCQLPAASCQSRSRDWRAGSWERSELFGAAITRRRFTTFLLRLHQHAHQVARGGCEHADDLDHRRLEQEQELRVELRLARHRRQLADFAGLDGPTLHHRRLDLQRRRGLGERGQHLGQQDRVLAAVGDGGRAEEVIAQRLEGRALHGAARQRVLDDLVAALGVADLAPQLGDLGNLEALVVDDHRALGALEGLLEQLQLRDFVRFRDCH